MRALLIELQNYDPHSHRVYASREIAFERVDLHQNGVFNLNSTSVEEIVRFKERERERAVDFVCFRSTTGLEEANKTSR